MSAPPSPTHITEEVILPADGQAAFATADVVEVSLLLSGAQMSALEMAAHRHHLTAAEMARRALAQFIQQVAW